MQVNMNSRDQQLGRLTIYSPVANFLYTVYVPKIIKIGCNL